MHDEALREKVQNIPDDQKAALEIKALQQSIAEREKKAPLELRALRQSNRESKTKARLEVTKLEAEIALLQREQKPEHVRLEVVRTYASVGGLLAGSVAAFGLVLSTCQWVSNAQIAERNKSDERLEKAVGLLAEKTPTQKLTGIVGVESFLDDTDPPLMAERAWLALTNALAVEDNATVRTAIIATLTRNGASLAKTPAASKALASLIGLNRAVASEGELISSRHTPSFQFDHVEGPEARALGIADAIIALLRAGVPLASKDLSKTYFARADFSSINLNGCSFSQSTLAWTNFTHADCDDCRFSGADLTETNFIEATLRRAVFGAAADNRSFENDFVAQQLYQWEASQAMAPSAADASIKKVGPHADARATQSAPGAMRLPMVPPFLGPGFACADLTDASFAGFPFLGFVPDPLTNGILASPSFRFAELSGADFRKAAIYNISEGESWPAAGEFPVPAEPTSGQSFRGGDGRTLWLTRGNLAEGEWHGELLVKYSKSVQSVWGAFEGATWRTAQLPQGLRQSLSARTEAHFDPGCTPRHPLPQDSGTK